MKFQKSLLATGVAVAIATLSACGGSSSSSDDSASATTPGVPTLTLTNDNIYVLAGGFPGTYVGNGEAQSATAATVDDVEMVVEPGTLILGNSGEALVVTRGSTIDVNGTATDPVVMGSQLWFNNWVNNNDVDSYAGVGESGFGEWAGFAMMGFAQVELGTDVFAEGNIGYYGGTDDADSSGEISYLLVRHAGNDIDGNGNELNGFTLFGTGSGTMVDHIQVHRGYDDGIEHFGSTDFMSHVVLTENQDDSFDWGHGYRGGVQFMLVKQYDDEIAARITGGDTPSADHMIEADNDGDAPDATPVSKPTIANATFMAHADMTDVDGGTNDSLRLRRGTGALIYNSIIVDSQSTKECVRVDGDDAWEQADAGELLMTNSLVANCDGTADGDADVATTSTLGGADALAWFDAASLNNRRGTTNTPDLNSLGVPDGTTVDLQDAAYAINLGGNFVATDYVGAFPQDTSADWTDGWTVKLHGNNTVWEPATGGTLAGAAPSSDGSCPAGTTFVEAKTLPASVGGGQMDVCQLQRRYTESDFTVEAGFPAL